MNLLLTLHNFEISQTPASKFRATLKRSPGHGILGKEEFEDGETPGEAMALLFERCAAQARAMSRVDATSLVSPLWSVMQVIQTPQQPEPRDSVR